MRKVTIKIIAIDCKEFQKEIATLSEQQVHCTFGPVKEVSAVDVLSGRCQDVTVVIDPKDFPEVDRFIITVVNEQKR